MMKAKNKLGEFFTLEEFTRSSKATQLGIKNEPTAEHIENMRDLVREILDPVRHIVGKIVLTSGYRSPELSVAVGGGAGSQHGKGQAADIYHEDLDALFELIKEDFIYDQVILESLDTPRGIVRWVHVSYAKGRNRGQSFRSHNHKRVSPILINKRWN